MGAHHPMLTAKLERYKPGVTNSIHTAVASVLSPLAHAMLQDSARMSPRVTKTVYQDHP